MCYSYRIAMAFFVFAQCKCTLKLTFNISYSRRLSTRFALVNGRIFATLFVLFPVLDLTLRTNVNLPLRTKYNFYCYSALVFLSKKVLRRKSSVSLFILMLRSHFVWFVFVSGTFDIFYAFLNSTLAIHSTLFYIEKTFSQTQRKLRYNRRGLKNSFRNKKN